MIVLVLFLMIIKVLICKILTKHSFDIEEAKVIWKSSFQQEAPDPPPSHCSWEGIALHHTSSSFGCSAYVEICRNTNCHAKIGTEFLHHFTSPSEMLPSLKSFVGFFTYTASCQGCSMVITVKASSPCRSPCLSKHRTLAVLQELQRKEPTSSVHSCLP